MAKRVQACLASLLLVGLGLPAAQADLAFCQRCHGMPTLGLLDPGTGQSRSFHVDEQAYQASRHGKLDCIACHQGDFASYPHEPAATSRAGSCLDCHRENGKWDRLRLPGITDQYQKSVHRQAFSQGAGCFSCHPIHAPDPMGTGKTVHQQVSQVNRQCMTCHPWSQKTGLAHRWLPEAARHLAEVRCVDCHAPDLGEVVHAIGPARRAERNCEACHRKDSLLVAKLYRHRVLEERQRAGFLNSVVLNEAYVVGMTRNTWLDWAGLIMTLLVIAGLLGHGIVRMLSHRETRP